MPNEYTNKQLAVIVNKDHIITEVLFHTFDDLPVKVDHHMKSLIHENSTETYFDVVKDVTNHEVCFGVKVTLKNNKEAFMFQLKTAEDVVLFLLGFNKLSYPFFRDIIELNNNQTQLLRKLSKDIISTDDDVALLDEIVRLNNELTNVKRELKEKKEELEAIHNTDHLTKIKNRRKFFIDIYKAAQVEEYQLIMMDFINFKVINDLYGHPKGDETLVRFTKLMNHQIEEYNADLYRLGGDEFAILVKEKLKLHFEEIVKQIEEDIQEIHPEVGIAFGTTIINKDNCNEQLKAELSMSVVDQQMRIMKIKSRKRKT